MREVFNRFTAVLLFLAGGVYVTVSGFGLGSGAAILAALGFACLMDLGIRGMRMADNGWKAAWSADDGAQLLYIPAWLACLFGTVLAVWALMPSA